MPQCDPIPPRITDIRPRGPARAHRSALRHRSQRGHGPLLAAVRSRNLTEALRLLDAPTRVTVTYDTEARACYADDIAGDLRDAGLEVLGHSGIRVVCDLITDDARKSDSDFYADLERLELALANRAPYPHFARMFQLIARPSRTR
ncbi:hypothetical protein ACSVDM_08165 [Nocardia sp. JW2]|uniref:hypothetical protein n=1 Tax=Nocardia sp. JW2 TaxID=3450738 RepID=UPI003F42A77C